MKLRICIFCEKEKDLTKFWVRWSPELGVCYACLAGQFRDYEAKKVAETE
jgi:hypothetical protein